MDGRPTTADQLQILAAATQDTVLPCRCNLLSSWSLLAAILPGAYWHSPEFQEIFGDPACVIRPFGHEIPGLHQHALCLTQLSCLVATPFCLVLYLQQYCQAPTGTPKSARSGTVFVTLQQCGNAAYGVCQSGATSSSSPCSYAFNGAGKCSKDQFWGFYNGNGCFGCGLCLSYMG